MTCAGCNLLEHSSEAGKVLRDGTIVCTDCPEWRLECEARHVLTLPTAGARRNYIDYRERRSKAQAERLRELVRELWEAQRATP